jgi:hypothetical protein
VADAQKQSANGLRGTSIRVANERQGIPKSGKGWGEVHSGHEHIVHAAHYYEASGTDRQICPQRAATFAGAVQIPKRCVGGEMAEVCLQQRQQRQHQTLTLGVLSATLAGAQRETNQVRVKSPAAPVYSSSNGLGIVTRQRDQTSTSTSPQP